MLFATIDAHDFRHQVGKRAIGLRVTVALGGVPGGWSKLDTSKIPPLILGSYTIRNATGSIAKLIQYRRVGRPGDERHWAQCKYLVGLEVRCVQYATGPPTGNGQQYGKLFPWYQY